MDEILESMNKLTSHCGEEAHESLGEDIEILEDLDVANTSENIKKFGERNKSYVLRMNLKISDYEETQDKVVISQISHMLDHIIQIYPPDKETSKIFLEKCKLFYDFIWKNSAVIRLK